MEARIARTGREGLGRLLEEVGQKERERERKRGTLGCSHLDLLYGQFRWTKKWGWGIILDLLVGGAGQGGDSKQKGLQKGFLLCYMKQTALRTGLLVGMCTYH